MVDQIFGYAFLNAWKEEQEDRTVLLKAGLKEDQIFFDDLRKSTERKEYKLMKQRLRKADILVIPSLDCLGKSCEDILREWQDITEEIQANIRVIQLSIDTATLQNTKENYQAMTKLLSFYADREKEQVKRNRLKGIQRAKNEGKIGRPGIEFPANWTDVYGRWAKKELTAAQAQQALGLKNTSFYKLVKRYQTQNEKSIDMKKMPQKRINKQQTNLVEIMPVVEIEKKEISFISGHANHYSRRFSR